MFNADIVCCASKFAMSKASGRLVPLDKYERVGPDFFGYYSSEVVNLLSQDEDVLPVSTQLSELPHNKCGEGGNNLVNHSYNFTGPLYSDGVGAGLSDFEKDRLKSLLRQSAFTLSSEVAEVCHASWSCLVVAKCWICQHSVVTTFVICEIESWGYSLCSLQQCEKLLLICTSLFLSSISHQIIY